LFVIYLFHVQGDKNFILLSVVYVIFLFCGVCVLFFTLEIMCFALFLMF